MNLIRVIFTLALIALAFYYWPVWVASLAALAVIWISYRLERTGL